MPTSCAVALCSNIGHIKGRLGFFSFPKEPSLRKKWIFNCFRKGNFNPQTSYVCSDHFEESDFENFLKVKLVGGKLLLKKNAIPKLNIHKKSSEEIPETSRSKRFKKYDQKKMIDSLVTETQPASLPIPMDDCANNATSLITMPNDMENYMEYHLMGSVSQIRMKPGCMPTRYQCQSDRKKRTSSGTERSYILKKQRKALIEECEKDLEERTVDTNQMELGETSSGSSVIFNNCHHAYSVKQETDERVHVENESRLSGSIPNDGEDSKYIMDQVIDEKGKVWSEEDFSTTWNPFSVKTEASDDFNVGNDSTVYIFSNQGVKNELNEMSGEEVVQESNLIRDKYQHMPNENNECTMIKIEDMNEIHPSIQLDPLEDKCDLTVVKSETREDSEADEERKYSINQVIDENGKVLSEENIVTAWNFHTVKIESSEDWNSQSKCTNSNEKDVSEMLSPIQMEQNVDVPSNVDSIHSKMETNKCYFCQLCDFSTSWRVSLQTHIKSIHQNEKNYKCHLCDYSSSYKQALKKHLKSVHLKLKNHKCKRCGYSSSLKGHLQRHVRSIHLNLRNHKCHICDYSSSEKAALQGHLKSVHLKPKKHKCHLCDYCSSQKRALETHIKTAHL